MFSPPLPPSTTFTSIAATATSTATTDPAPSPPSSSSSLSAPRPPKSPPLAFERTPNDSLVPPTTFNLNNNDHNHQHQHHHHHHHFDDRDRAGAFSSSSPSTGNMGRLTPLSESPLELQAIIEKQAEVISQLHKAFNVERETWDLERQRFFNRIQALERLLKNGEHHSPAKSPEMNPSNLPDIVSPRAIHPTKILPTIAEDENIQPLSLRRDGARLSIELPSTNDSYSDKQNKVTFTNAEGLRVEELVIPNRSTEALSPPPPINRMLAGHTPVRVPRRPTPPPMDMSMDGIEDTPTRNNTHINAFLTQSDEEDMPLKGPLNMPELPHRPDAGNFTLDALTERLHQMVNNPDQSKPLVYSRPSPGLASPVNERSSKNHSPSSKLPSNETPISPTNTRAQDGKVQGSQVGSNLSPSISNTDATPMSPQEAHEAKVHAEFQEGGIRLKKKTSINFGAPFGSLALPGNRKLS